MKAILKTAAGVAIFAASAASAAITSAFNPDSLAEVELTRVANVCQTVMGLSSKERLSGGEWRSGGDRLGYWTSHYRACVTSLSDSVVEISNLKASRQADGECRARGYKSGSSDLALCMLAAKDRPRNQQVADATTALPLPAANGSFLYARPAEIRKREENACAAIGAGTDFNTCVKSLEKTFFAMDNPIS